MGAVILGAILGGMLGLILGVTIAFMDDNKNKGKDCIKANQDRFFEGMYIGIAFGRFYEKHNITDSIPYELADEYNTIFENAMKEYHEKRRNR